MSLRRELLAELYGERGDDIADQLDVLVAATLGVPRGPSWSERDAWLIIYPDQFGSAGLRGVAEVAGALAPSINGVHLLPFHPSSSDGGFSVEDYAVVDSDFGSWADVQALGAQGRMMADAVINHVSSQGTWFRGHLAGDPAFADFFRVVPDGTDLAAVQRPRPGLPVTRFARSDGSEAQYWTTFGADQVDLDYRSPEVLVAAVEAVLRYIAAGASAVRLDAIAFVGKDPATSSMHLPEAHSIVAIIRDCVQEVDPSVVLITETNVAHNDNISYLGSVARPEAHAVYQFTLAPLVLHAVQTGDVDPLIRWAAQLDSPPETTVLNFLASHDGVGVRPAIGWLDSAQIEAMADRCRESGGVVNEAAVPGGAEPYELAATWRALCGVGIGGPFTVDEVARRHLATHSIALALAGIPLVYVHSLVASANAVERWSRTQIGRDLNRGRFSSVGDFVDRMSGGDLAGIVATGMHELLGWRGSSGAFHPDSSQRVLAAPPGVFAIERSGRGERARVITNMSGVGATVEVGSGWRRFDSTVVSPPRLEIGPWEAIWLRRVDESGVVSAR